MAAPSTCSPQRMATRDNRPICRIGRRSSVSPPQPERCDSGCPHPILTPRFGWAPVKLTVPVVSRAVPVSTRLRKRRAGSTC